MKIKKHIIRSVSVAPSARLAQVLGMFDVSPLANSIQEWDVEFNLPEKWNVGVIVGPSGSGKTTVAGELFGNSIAGDFSWPQDKSILDGFPPGLGVRDIVGLLSSVGFSSPPAWVRPFQVLSNGQQFRVTLARTLAEAMIDGKPKLLDEYSSVVDRTVARIGSAAVAKTVRRSALQFIAVTCHYDVLDWLEPDWVYEPHTNRFQTAAALSPDRECLHRRPLIEMEIIRTDRTAWPAFKPHHYLSGSLHNGAACFLGLIENQPAAFTAVLPFPHPTRSGWREHRTVCLPDFQGVGIGNAMSEFVASLYKATGKPYTSTTSHPAMIRHRAKSPLWRMSRVPGLIGGGRGKRFNLMRKTSAIDRLTAGFEYIGPPRTDDANAFGLRTRADIKRIPFSPS
jgi:hypothetical protein